MWGEGWANELGVVELGEAGVLLCCGSGVIIGTFVFCCGGGWLGGSSNPSWAARCGTGVIVEIKTGITHVVVEAGVVIKTIVARVIIVVVVIVEAIIIVKNIVIVVIVVSV